MLDLSNHRGLYDGVYRFFMLLVGRHRGCVCLHLPGQWWRDLSGNTTKECCGPWGWGILTSGMWCCVVIPVGNLIPDQKVQSSQWREIGLHGSVQSGAPSQLSLYYLLMEQQSSTPESSRKAGSAYLEYLFNLHPFQDQQIIIAELSSILTRPQSRCDNSFVATALGTLRIWPAT